MTFTNPLVPEIIQPRWVKIDYNRCDHKTGAPVVEFRECHLFLPQTDGGVDMFIVEHGRLHRTISFNGVVSVEEVAQPE